MKLEFSDEKTLITHSQKAAKFLGYAVLANRSNLAKRDNTGRLSRVYNKKVLLRISMETIKKKLLDFGVLEVKTHNGKEHWKPREHRKLSVMITWKSFKSITTRLEDSTTIMRLQTTVLYSTLTSISWSIVCIKRLPANTRAKYPRLPANINKMVYSLYNIRAVREERSNRHFTTKVSQEEKPEIGENIDNSTVVYHANRTSLIDRLKSEV